MGKYLLIESRDPFDSADSEFFFELVEVLSNGGNDTILFLTQNGVLPTRKGSKHNDMLSKLIRSKVKVMADRFSLRERAIGDPVDGIEVADVDQLVDLLLEPGTKAIWH